jgi:hypothetical protein
MTERPEDELNMLPEKEVPSLQKSQEDDDDYEWDEWDEEWEDLHKDSTYVLNEQQEKNLKKMQKFVKELDRVPPEERFIISNPEKYDYPIGTDDDGNLFEDI